MLARPEWTAFPPALAARPRPQLRPDLLSLLRLWLRRSADRRALAGLDARDLRDIGMTRADAQHEAAKPFWRS